MPKIKTADLTGAALDWAVAVAEGESPIYTRHWVIPSHPENPRRVCTPKLQGYWQPYEPSQNWGLGGPIIEQEAIGLTQFSDYPKWTAKHPESLCIDGPTPLTAGMRCFVASRFGDIVEIPEELL